MSDWKKLREAAERATPGPWRVDVEKQRTTLDGKPIVMGIYGPELVVDYGMGPERHDPRIVETDSGYYEPKWDDAAFIAAANPTTILALLDENDSLRAEVERLKASHSETVRRRLADDLLRAEQSLERALAAKDEACEIALQWAAHLRDMHGDPQDRARIALLRSIGKDGGNG